MEIIVALVVFEVGILGVLAMTLQAQKTLLAAAASESASRAVEWLADSLSFAVPFDIKNVELDFQILDPLEEGLQMQVLLVAAKREFVDHKVSLLLDAGVSPAAIDVDAFALHNAFAHNHPEAMRGIVALVNIGHETTNVNILEDGDPHSHAGHPLWVQKGASGPTAGERAHG